MADQTSRPATPTQDLWSSILDSVSSTRSIPSKQVLLLGEPQTGKSTLASALLQKRLDTDAPVRDFALGYDWADIRDEADEDTLARLSIYTVPSSAPSYSALLPHILPPKISLSSTLVIIVLDWTRPWTFVEHLELWLSWVDKWARGDGSRELEVVREEGRERLQYHLQHYSEPTSDPIPLTTTAALASATLLPLGQGTLTHNPAGVPIIVVCSKADLIDDNNDIVGVGTGGMGGMVKGKGGEWEERTDGIMQVLRTICLKYGAALFYTTPLPSNLSLLRQYMLHLLFTPPPPTPAIGTTEAPAPTKNPFPFPHRSNVLDRDRIVVPAGWDSWGKIAVLREGFEAARWGEAWEKDLEDGGNVDGAKAMFTALVGGDRGVQAPPLPPMILPTPEQTFLQRHHETLSKDPARDPRASFRPPAADGTMATTSGVVGPMSSSSFSLPSVERALVEMEGGERFLPGTKTAPRRDTGRPHPPPASHGQPSLVVPSRQAGQPASPPLGGSPLQPGAGKTQHEVLHNFFQSLLSARGKDGAPGAPGVAGTTATGNPPPNVPQSED